MCIQTVVVFLFSFVIIVSYFNFFVFINLKASLSLTKLETASDLNNFLAFFTKYGDDLVELARLSGERQNVCIQKNCIYLRIFNQTIAAPENMFFLFQILDVFRGYLINLEGGGSKKSVNEEFYLQILTVRII